MTVSRSVAISLQDLAQLLEIVEAFVLCADEDLTPQPNWPTIQQGRALVRQYKAGR